MFVINVDNALAKIGFVKVHESNLMVQYEREIPDGYTQCLDICHKKSGKHIIQSYQKDVNKNGFNNAVGLTLQEAELACIKMRRMKW